MEGWRRLDELKVGHHIATPRILQGPDQDTMSHAELGLLGHLIGDGCTLPSHAIQYTTRDRELAGMVATLAEGVFGGAGAPRISPERSWDQGYPSSAPPPAPPARHPVAAGPGDPGGLRLRP